MVIVGDVVASLRSCFESGRTKDLAWRRSQLDALDRMLGERGDDIEKVLTEDLGKSPLEAFTTEIGIVRREIGTARRHLKRWAKPRRVRLGITSRPGRAVVRPEPLGVVLIFAPWNYPVMLSLSPMVAALAAGNAVLLKPSEVTPNVASLLHDLCDEYLDHDAVRVVEGGPEMAEQLLEQRFDHIFFTGNGTVGRVVMAAAAKNLTPVTLELGGKSPTIVHRSADLEVAARRIAWGKGLNGGQSCVAPDYVLVEDVVKDRLVELIRENFASMHMDAGEPSQTMTAIVTDRHVGRVRRLLDDQSGTELAISEERRVAPVVVVDPDLASVLMTEEIFAPILPVIGVPNVESAVSIVNQGERPLALYVFANDRDVVRQITYATSSGGVCVNHTMFQFAAGELPFGGVGESGFGSYHGRYGFDRLSHLKPILTKPNKPDIKLIYPPYSKRTERLFRRFL